MKNSSLLFAAAASVAVLFATAAFATPLTNVVYGNLGATGTNALGATSTVIGPGAGSEVWVAQGFNTGTSGDRALSSIALGLASLSPSVSAYVEVYTDNAGAPGSLFATSSVITVSGSAQARYVFPFTSSGTFAPNATYWVVPSAGVQWYHAVNEAGSATPSGKNSSGYNAASPISTIESDTADIVPGDWGSASSNRYGISVQAVPEPSTYALAGIGLATAGLIRWRRRQVSRRES